MRTPDAELRQRRREELLDAAAVCFADKGFAQTRTAEITRRAGLSAGSLFYYFPTKHAVLMALIERETAAVAAVEVPRERLAARAVMHGLFDAVCEQAADPVARGLALEIAALALRDADVAAHSRGSDAALRLLLGQLATAGASTRDQTVAATWLAAIIDGVFTRAAVQEDFDARAQAPDLHLLIDSFLGW